ncbi:MAG TPA: ATP-binding protein [Terriglobales bacterium]|nr:ATP-binding protein [Terriglobales bacterium]
MAALSTLSAAWRRCEPGELAERLGAELSRVLPAALVYVRLAAPSGTAAMEAACSGQRALAAGAARDVGRCIERALVRRGADEARTIPDPLGDGLLRVVVARLGHEGDCGVVVAGSHKPEFPSQTDRLLLDVAAAQATIVLQQRRAEETLRRQGDLFTTLVEHIPDIVARLDRDLRFLYISPAVTRATGKPWQEYIGKPRTNQGLTPEDAAIRDELSRRVFETGEEQRLEFPMQTPSGPRFMESRLIPEFGPDGSVESLMTLVRDVTDRKRAEERARLLWEAAAVLLTANDPDGMLRELFARIGPHVGVDVCVNHVLDEGGDTLRLASCEGIAPEAARPIARLDLGQGVAGAVALRREPLVVTSIQRSDDPNVALVKAFGIRACVSHPLVAGSRLLGTLTFASRTRDRFEPDDLAFLETICHYVTVAYERLRLLNELKEVDRRKDEFLATLAHELRNPLAPLRNAAQLLRVRESAEAELRWGRDVIERQVEWLTRLIDDLLDISRITRNNLELRRQRVEIADVVNGAVESSRPLIDARGHALTVTLPSEPIYVDGDVVRLAQVFLNLLNNAAKYTEPGGRIRLTAALQGDEVVVRVTDTGMGIPPEKLPRLFEMFFQVDRSLERTQGGLGVGLSLVRRLVELHGGRVTAHSDGVGAGSEFTVRLPVLADTPALLPDEPPAAGRTPAAAARRILVVDDNRDAAESLTLLLRLSGNEVEAAYDGLEAVEAAERWRPDVVLLDIGMPKLNGYDACRRIRAEPWGTSMLLVALTGWGQAEDKRRTAEAGFDAHMVKPVDPDAVLALLGRLRDGRGTPR